MGSKPRHQVPADVEGAAVTALQQIHDEHAARGETRLITRDGEPYLYRTYLGGRRGPGRAYLHRFVSGDDPVHHNHPWDVSTSIILAGSYIEHRRTMIRPVTVDGSRRYPPPDDFQQVGPERHRTFSRGCVNVIYRDTFHWVELVTPEVWTLFVPGRRVGGWGFLEGDEFVPEGVWKSKRGGE